MTSQFGFYRQVYEYKNEIQLFVSSFSCHAPWNMKHESSVYFQYFIITLKLENWMDQQYTHPTARNWKACTKHLDSTGDHFRVCVSLVQLIFDSQKNILKLKNGSIFDFWYSFFPNTHGKCGNIHFFDMPGPKQIIPGTPGGTIWPRAIFIDSTSYS